MKRKILFLGLALLSGSCLGKAVGFDADWRFSRGDPPGAERPEFQDASWQQVNLPHDWSIAGPFEETNSAGGAGAFLPSGIGWYRKDFALQQADATRRVLVEFDGVMANSDVWINGHHLSHRPSGYVSFMDDLTGHLFFGGGTNVLAVRTDTSQQPASRWYAGAGIYRHVHLLLVDPVHLEPGNVFVTTPQVSALQATVKVQPYVTNNSGAASKVSAELEIVDEKGRTVGKASTPAQNVPVGGAMSLTLETKVKKPRLWDVNHPALYQARVTLRGDNSTLDAVTISFGIREFHFDSATGFWLNGRNFKLKGVCLHEDGSCFGAAVPLDVWESRLRALRDLGVNAIRTAHNPPAPDFLDLCDRMGFLVMDEFFDCWTVGKNPFDYHLYFTGWSKLDARDTLQRDRNHPSIIFYSVGNEIHDTPHAARAFSILAGLVEVCRENDPTRPVTQALFRPNVSGDYTNGLADLLDVIGTNYRDNELLAAQRARPSRKILGTEQRQDRATWLECRDHPQHAGQFLWSGVDYLGESRRWPIIAAGSGLLDRCGWPKPLAFQRQSWWSDKPMVFIARRRARESAESGDPGFAPLDRGQTLFADWTPVQPAPRAETVEVYSNCEEVELRINGRSLGAQTLPADASPRIWTVPFEAGEFAAVGRNHGRVVAQNTLRTAGPAAQIVLTANKRAVRADWDGVAEVRAQVVDARGVPAPTADNLITFDLSGPGVIAAVDNADNSSHESFQAPQRRAFKGECAAMIKATSNKGTIRLTASADGLKSASLTIPIMEGERSSLLQVQ
ncbi:MAG TPA: glycoside hydrolase family 2 TIM barrel-domain containing protein [Candidatus Saccharimonadales bacterium]|nr:glycoside hydrolase family 2 TIM barrel-domain containing protein [Candidatus Saccharimonadales bacterium]